MNPSSKAINHKSRWSGNGYNRLVGPGRRPGWQLRLSLCLSCLLWSLCHVVSYKIHFTELSCSSFLPLCSFPLPFPDASFFSYFLFSCYPLPSLAPSTTHTPQCVTWLNSLCLEHLFSQIEGNMCPLIQFPLLFPAAFTKPSVPLV